jgi:hypothetical protein
VNIGFDADKYYLVITMGEPLRSQRSAKLPKRNCPLKWSKRKTKKEGQALSY